MIKPGVTFYNCPYIIHHLTHTEILCPALPTVPHAQVNDTSVLTQTQFSIGSAFLYICDTDYRFIDGTSEDELMCDQTGQWVGIDSFADGKYSIGVLLCVYRTIEQELWSHQKLHRYFLTKRIFSCVFMHSSKKPIAFLCTSTGPCILLWYLDFILKCNYYRTNTVIKTVIYFCIFLCRLHSTIYFKPLFSYPR